MVAQNFADVTFLSSISRTRWSFLKTDVPVVARLMVPFVVPIDDARTPMPKNSEAAMGNFVQTPKDVSDDLQNLRTNIDICSQEAGYQVSLAHEKFMNVASK